MSRTARMMRLVIRHLCPLPLISAYRSAARLHISQQAQCGADAESGYRFDCGYPSRKGQLLNMSLHGQLALLITPGGQIVNKLQSTKRCGKTCRG